MMTTRKYTPRRQSKRWLDGDCPDGVLAIYDDPKYADRFTVFYREVYADHSGKNDYAHGWLSYRGGERHVLYVFTDKGDNPLTIGGPW